MMRVCNQARSQRHSSFFPSARTFQVISNRNFHSKEKIFIRNEVNRQYLGYSSLEQLQQHNVLCHAQRTCIILKCDFFTHFGSFFLKLHDVSTSHLEALVTLCFLSRELLRKQELVVDRGQLVSLFTVH